MDQKTINRRNRNRGKSHERRVAEKLGNWFRIPYSGSSELWGLGDVRDKDDKFRSRYMIECKTITPKSVKEVNFIIKQEWLQGKTGIIDKAKKELNKFWGLAFTKKGSSKTFIIIPLEDFRTYTRAIEILRAKGIIDDSKDVSRETTTAEIDRIYNEINE